jgi:hypothetical protein
MLHIDDVRQPSNKNHRWVATHHPNGVAPIAPLGFYLLARKRFAVAQYEKRAMLNQDPREIGGTPVR